jgi:hypothetical protein
MGQSFRAVLGAALGIAAFTGAAYAVTDPPSQVGRLAYAEGAVSFHDDQEADWSRAAINTPLTSGDSIWTEPNARSEISVAGTRVRMDGGTQLDMLAIDDSQTQLQVGQGRVDIKTFSFDPNVPYQVVTPRGTVSLRQQGDYYIEAGSTQDATRLGVRSGAAQIQSLDGQTAIVNPGQVAEIYGDTGALQLRTLNSAPPPQPAHWAARDRQINYDVPQYLSAGITGYEDLNAYGSWSNDSEFGNVWTPRTVPRGWQPYRNGHWTYVRPWGWTWVDDQPWGYAPSHYGRWANRNNRWIWVPPQREVQPVYAPALVAFIGGIELAVTLGARSNAPVGWFPLAPREAYVPSYSADRAYYTRLNSSNRVREQALEDRWQRAQRREAFVAGQNSVLANQRFATVIPSDAFVRSQPVARAALRVTPTQIAAAPVAPVAAPPAPTASIAVAASASAPAAKTADPATPAAKPADPKTATPAPAAGPKAEADAKAKAAAQAKAGASANLPVAKTAIADMPTLAKPTATTKPRAPGPKLATAPNTPAATTNATGSATGTTRGKTVAPPLVPRTGAAPPVLKDDGKAPAKPAPAIPEAKAPAANDNKTPRAPNAVTPAPATTAKPAEPPKAATPPVQQQSKPEPAKPADVPKAAAPPQARPAPPSRPAETRQPPANDKTPDKGATVKPQRPAPIAEPPKPPSAPAQQRQVVPQQAPKATPAPPRPEPKAPEQAERKPGPPPAPAEKKADEKK